MTAGVAPSFSFLNPLPEGHVYDGEEPVELPEGAPEPLERRVAAAAQDVLSGQEEVEGAPRPVRRRWG